MGRNDTCYVGYINLVGEGDLHNIGSSGGMLGDGKWGEIAEMRFLTLSERKYHCHVGCQRKKTEPMI